MWEIDYSNIESWLDEQDDETVALVFAALEVLRDEGPNLGRPLVDSIKGSRMKNMKPVITELPKVEVVVSNEMILAEVEKIRGSVLNTLKLHLHNSDIELTLRLDEHRQEVRLLTRREQFEELMRMNPVVAKLKAAFDLDIA